MSTTTVITPMQMIELRSELAELRAQVAVLEQKLAALCDVREDVDSLEAWRDEADDRLSRGERITSEMASAVRQLVAGITVRDLVIERVEKHMLAVMGHLRVQHVAVDVEVKAR